MRAFITSHFGYSPLAWMHHTRTMNNEINKLRKQPFQHRCFPVNIAKFLRTPFTEHLWWLLLKLHERALRLVYNYRESTFEELVDKDNSFNIHHRNPQVLATEMYKVHSNVRIIISVYHEKERIPYLGPKAWNLVSESVKDSENVNNCKLKIKIWKLEICLCRLCTVYLPSQISFL